MASWRDKFARYEHNQKTLTSYELLLARNLPLEKSRLYYVLQLVRTTAVAKVPSLCHLSSSPSSSSSLHPQAKHSKQTRKLKQTRRYHPPVLPMMRLATMRDGDRSLLTPTPRVFIGIYIRLVTCLALACSHCMSWCGTSLCFLYIYGSVGFDKREAVID